MMTKVTHISSLLHQRSPIQKEYIRWALAIDDNGVKVCSVIQYSNEDCF